MSHQSTSSGWTFLKYISSLNRELLIFYEKKSSRYYVFLFLTLQHNFQMRISHWTLVFSLVAASSLLAEADTLDTLGLALLDRGLVALRRVLLKHKPGVGGVLRCGPGLGLRWIMRTQRRGAQGEQRSETRRGRWGALLTGRRGQGGRGTLMEGVTGMMMRSEVRRREGGRGRLGGGRRRRRLRGRLGGGRGGGGPGEVIVSVALQHKQCAATSSSLGGCRPCNKQQSALEVVLWTNKSLCLVNNRHWPHSCGSSCPGSPRTWWTRPAGRWTGETGDRAESRAGEGSLPRGQWYSGQPSRSKPGAEILKPFDNKCKTLCLEALLEFFIWTIITMSNRVTEVGYELVCALDMISWSIMRLLFPDKN